MAHALAEEVSFPHILQQYHNQLLSVVNLLLIFGENL